MPLVSLLAATLAATCPPNVANSMRPAAPLSSRQLITVRAATAHTTRASARIWRRAGACWVAAGGPYPARVGWNGLSANRREGDGTTPIGTFPIERTMYGTEPNPGVRFRYTRLRCGDWWVEDPTSPSYNTFRRLGCGVRPPFRVTTPDMSKSQRAYAFLAVIGFNLHPIVRGRGSGIFLHAQTGRATNGCVSLRRSDQRDVLRWLSPGAGAGGGAAAPTGFTASISPVRAADLGSSYRAGCPVEPARLRLVRVSFRGFDRRPHRGAIVVARRVASDVVRVFRRLYDVGFPIRRMRPVSAYGGSDERSMAADNTSGFNCRAAVASGPKRWSVHAYGEAIDVNPVENPYLLGTRILPIAGRRFLDRTEPRPGMALPGGVLVRAFASVGWRWGGAWGDYQHFSTTGR